MISRYNKLDIADEMLDAAISAFFNTKQYFVAINLAGVAEDLFGGFVEANGGKHGKNELIKLASEIAAMERSGSLSHADWMKIANHNKNHIKHLNSLEPEQLFVDLDAEDEARAAIGMAIANHDKLNRVPSQAVQRFWIFAKAWSENRAFETTGPA